MINYSVTEEINFQSFSIHKGLGIRDVPVKGLRQRRPVIAQSSDLKAKTFYC